MKKMNRNRTVLFLLAAVGLMGASSGEARADSCFPEHSHYSRGRWHRGYSVRIVDSLRPAACWPRSYRARYHSPKSLAWQPQEETLVINVPNDNGSYTPVTLRRAGGVYVGPRGEQYLNVPSVEQLKEVYGLK